MKEQFEQLWQRYRLFPRAVQWALAAGIGIVLFVIWNDHIKTIGDEWAAQADRIEEHVREVRNSSELAGNFTRMRDAIESLGAVDVPVNEKETTDALNGVINEIIKKHRGDVDVKSFTRSAGDRLRKGSLQGIVGPGEVARRLTGDFEFEATPEVAAAVLTELENSPDIEAVTELRLSTVGNRRVNVKLKIEAWIVARDTTKSRV